VSTFEDALSELMNSIKTKQKRAQASERNVPKTNGVVLRTGNKIECAMHDLNGRNIIAQR